MTHNGLSIRQHGLEQQTSGLWVHRGKLSAGAPGTAPAEAGDINANRGNGTGVYYFAGKNDKYLYYDTANFHLIGGPLAFTPAANTIPTSAIQANAVQELVGAYFATTSWQTPAAGAWYETPIQVTTTFGGATVRMEASFNVYNNTVGAYTQCGFGIDGVMQWALAAVHQNTANYQNYISMSMYFAVPVGAHRVSVWLMAAGGGVSVIWSGVYATLYLTEQKR